MHPQARVGPKPGWRISTAELFGRSCADGVAVASIRREWTPDVFSICIDIVLSRTIQETMDVSRR